MKTTPLSGEPDVLNGPSPEAEPAAPDQRRVDLRAASSESSRNRGKKTPQQIDQIAQGRVWDGGTARQIGLVDGFGGMDEAIAKAAELAKLGDERGVTYLERPTSFKEQLLDMLAQQERDEGAAPADGFAFFANGQRKLAQALADIRSILDGPSIQVRCLECPLVRPRGSSAATSASWPALATGCSRRSAHQAEDQPERGELKDVVAAVDQPQPQRPTLEEIVDAVGGGDPAEAGGEAGGGCRADAHVRCRGTSRTPLRQSG